MRVLASWSASQLAFTIAGWLTIVLVAWLFTPGGQAVIMVIRLAIEEHGTFAVELPLNTIRVWAMAAGLAAICPSVVLVAVWTVARRAARKAAA